MYERIKQYKHNDIIHLKNRTRIIDTRNKFEYLRIKPKTNLLKNSILYQGVKHWDELKETFKKINNIQLFKKKIKKHLVTI